MGQDARRADRVEASSRFATWTSRIALGLALGLALVLATRLVANNDVGYHLAYGERLLDSGRPVDSGEFVFTTSDGRTGDPALDYGPGCWYDSQGAYRFPNANWLSQVVLAVVWRAAGTRGPIALSLLLVALVASALLLALATMRRGRVPMVWIAVGLLLMGLAAQARFVLRPEVFGYAIMAAQIFLLLPVLDGTRVPTWKWVALGAVLHGLLVNLHSYFVIGLALTGAVLIDRLLRSLRPGRPAWIVAQTKRLSVLLGLQLVACFVNPWTWRLAALPIQTLLYLSSNGIVDSSRGERHPWWSISEFASPLAAGWAALLRPDFFLVVGLAALAVVSCLRHRRLGHLLIAVGITAVGLSMQRNLALAALILTPVAFVAARELLADAVFGWPRLVRFRADVWVGGIVAVVSSTLIVLVATQSFYRRGDSLERFGLGLSRLNMPLGPAAWINDYLPRRYDRIWTDFNSSSNVHYFTEPRREVEFLTNTWAVPPFVMREALRVNGGAEPFGEIGRRYAVKCVVLEVYDATERFAAELAWDPEWALVYLDAVYTVFLRVEPETMDLVRRFAITPSSLDVAAHARRLRTLDPVAADGVLAGAWTLARLGALSPAVTLLREVVAERADDAGAWSVLGATLYRRGESRLGHGDRTGADDLREARDCLRRVLEIDALDPLARDNLITVEQRLERVGG